ncbi:unnamed protein product [Brachionus calyciflorus]|uniref:Uncharacterized protein n=1 Tax=Brachionus calyciflorus TaxID=104777 RepID=A0A814FW02_9BILA|nr:unnamed protein product [Brachionus calyciflorus]
MMALTFHIPDEKHPFHHLNGAPFSVDVRLIQDPVDKEELLKDSIISFPHEYENQVLLVEALIKSKKK